MSSERRLRVRDPARPRRIGRSRGARGLALLLALPLGLALGVAPARGVRADDEGRACPAPGTAPIAAPSIAGDGASAAAIASKAARRAANAARVAVLEGRADAAAQIDAAAAIVEAMPASAHDRLALELHVLRTRQLASEGAAPAKASATARADDRVSESDRALAAAFARIGESARVRGEDGPRAWAQVYGAELALERGEPEAAAALLDAARLVPESDTTWEAHVTAERLHADLVADEDAAIRSLERARRLLERRRPQLETARYLALARPIHERLAGRLLGRGASRETATAAQGDASDQARLREVLALLESLKLAELRTYFGDACLADLATTTPEAVPGTLLLYPVVLADRVELIAGHGGRLVHRTAPIGPDELVERVRALRGALQDPTSPRHRAAASRLFEALIAPLDGERAALGDGAMTLVVVPSGALREIPFAALFDARVGRYLVEDVALATLPSLHVLPSEPLDPNRTRLLAAGVTTGIGEFTALPFAARELEAAAQRFPATRRLDAAFTRAAFEEDLEAAPYDVVHIASHGLFDARASESFLLAHDGRIGLAELGLWIGRTRHRTGRPLELLVLSACETAIGDERAVLGLAGVAVQAGARSAIASLWKVHDEATMQLFARFYRELGQPGVGRAEALRRAQRSLIAEPRFRHPIYWSAFLLVNGWR